MAYLLPHITSSPNAAFKTVKNPRRWKINFGKARQTKARQQLEGERFSYIFIVPGVSTGLLIWILSATFPSQQYLGNRFLLHNTKEQTFLLFHFPRTESERDEARWGEWNSLKQQAAFGRWKSFYVQFFSLPSSSGDGVGKKMGQTLERVEKSSFSCWVEK